MLKETIYDQIKNILPQHFDITVDEVNGAMNFKNDLKADSINVMELILDLEDTFKIEINDDDVENIQTVNDLVNYLNDHQN